MPSQAGKLTLRHSPAAITGSFMISRVIGQRYSSGVPLETGAIFTSSIFFMTLLRRPRDSERAQEHFSTTQSQKSGTLKYQYICANRSAVVWPPISGVSHSFCKCWAETGTNSEYLASLTFVLRNWAFTFCSSKLKKKVWIATGTITFFMFYPLAETSLLGVEHLKCSVNVMGDSKIKTKSKCPHRTLITAKHPANQLECT